MAVSQTGNFAHDQAVDAAEGVRQVAVAAATTQAAANAAHVTFFRACIASAKTNNCPGVLSLYNSALKELGWNS